MINVPRCRIFFVPSCIGKMSRPAKFFGVLVVALALGAYGQAPFLSAVANILIVEDSLQPAVAIVALGGQTPFREIEAAKIYRRGLAPQIVIVREAPTAESEALRELGINKIPQWELARAVLIQQGVPPEAIVIPKDEAVGTLEELRAVWDAIEQGAWSREAVHAKESTEHGAGSREPMPRTTNATNATNQRSEVRGQKSDIRGNNANKAMNASGDVKGEALGVRGNAMNAKNAERDNAINATNAPRVILVTSKYHTRRTRVTWQYVSGDRSQAIVRAASGDPFDPESWWHTRSYVLSVVREYLGLFNYWLGFPVAP
jgi:uncharacterized SAM-binding protein YcdF (DUF218 family)